MRVEFVGSLLCGLTADLDMKNHKIVNLKTPENSTDGVNWSFLSQELSNYANKSGTDFTGDIDMKNNKIFNIGLSTNSNSAVNRQFVNN